MKQYFKVERAGLDLDSQGELIGVYQCNNVYEIADLYKHNCIGKKVTEIDYNTFKQLSK